MFSDIPDALPRHTLVAALLPPSPADFGVLCNKQLHNTFPQSLSNQTSWQAGLRRAPPPAH